MVQNRMQDSQLDLEAPLISARRRSVPPAVNSAAKLEDPASMNLKANSMRSTVPSYNSELKSGPFRKPGAIPFVWEKKPGQPRAGTASHYRPPPIPLLPPGRKPIETDPNGPSSNNNPIFLGFAENILEKKATESPMAVAAEVFLNEKEENKFFDAVKTLSCTESFFMNCSFSGLSGIPDVVEPSKHFSIDPQVRALMMDRFLPAAQAMATRSPHSPRKPLKQANCVENREHQFLRARLPYQHRPNFVAQYPHDKIYSSDDDDDDQYDDNFEVGGRHQLSHSANRKISSILHSNVPLSQAEDEPCDSVNKLKKDVMIHHQGEGMSKIMKKSNQHVNWSKLQALGCSSSSESLIKDVKKYSVMNSSHGSQQGSGVYSPKRLNDVIVDSVNSKHGSTDSELGFKSLIETSDSASVVSENRLDNQIMEENFFPEGYNEIVPQPKIAGVLETDMVLCSTSSPMILNAIEHVNNNDGSLFVKGGNQSKNNSSFLQSLSPPPLPKTPSESWLSRTLPSVSAKVTSKQSLYKHAFHSSPTIPRKGSDVKPSESFHLQVSTNLCEPQQCHTTLTDSEEGGFKHSEPIHDIIIDIKPSKPLHRQIRFADVLMTPLSPRSEM